MGSRLMATCLRMRGTDWPEGPSAASGQHLPSTTCEQLGVLRTSRDLNCKMMYITFLFTALPPRFFFSHEVAVYLSNRLRGDFNF